MRLVLKAALILVVTIGVQYLIGGHASGGVLDEAQFTMRVGVAKLAGTADNNQDLVDAATELMRRQEARAQQANPESWTHGHADMG